MATVSMRRMILSALAFFALGAAGTGGAGGAAWAGAPRAAVANVAGDAVIPGKFIAAQPAFEVRNIRCWDGQRADTGSRCTIVTGDLVNMTDCEGWTIKVEVWLWRGTTEMCFIGIGSTTIEHPGTKYPVPFRLALPPSLIGARLNHLVRLSVQ